MSYQFIGLDHVQIAAPRGCEETASNFYANIIGMIEVEKPEELRKRGGVWFQCGPQQLHVGVEDDFRPAKKAHPAFHVQDLKSFRAHLIESGVKVKDDDALEGAIRIFVDDPFGNRLEFLEWSKKT